MYTMESLFCLSSVYLTFYSIQSDLDRIQQRLCDELENLRKTLDSAETASNNLQKRGSDSQVQHIIKDSKFNKYTA